jgi:hypothetical protein
MSPGQQLEFLSRPQFPYKQFCSVVGHNENTIRTWITKHLPNIGYKQENNKWMLYSGLDCIKTVIFAELIDLSLSREAAKVVTLAAQSRVKELALLSDRGALKAQKEPKYMVINRADKNSATGHRAISAFGLAKIKMIESVDTPSILLPIDAIFWRVTARIEELEQS